MPEIVSSDPSVTDDDLFWVKNRAEFLAKLSSHADPGACGTCRSRAEAGQPVEHEECQQRATLLQAPDHPYYEILAGFPLEENEKLPPRFHIPVFDDCGVPNSWLCAVCQDEGTVVGWPCATATKYGNQVFTDQHKAEAAQKKQAARIVELETALAAAGRSLSSFIFDSDDPGADALGAQWLYHQAMPQADDPFAQPRAFRSSVFSEAATEVEKLDAQAPDDRRDHSQGYLDGYSDGVQDAAERLEKLADQAAEGTEPAS